MPRFMSESYEHIPMSGATINIASGILVIPSGNIISDVEARLLSDTLTVLDSEVKFVPASGTFMIASGSGPWIAIQLN